jgi:hypothetical protein
MKNPIRTEGDVAYIGLRDRHGEALAEAKVDTSDLPRLHRYGGSWCAANLSGRLYAKSGGNLLLHRFLTDAPKGAVVDHINRDTLDNRQANLRIVDQQANSENAVVYRATTATGIKNVSLLRGEAHRKNPYMVRVMSGYVMHHIGVFPTLEEATKAAEEARKRLHPCCPENSDRQ